MKIVSSVIQRFSCSCINLVITVGLGLMAGPVAATDYEVVDLGTNVSPKDINSYRVIAGARNTDQYPNIAFRWTPGLGFEDLDGTSANAVNDAGKIAGSTLTGAFVLDGNSMRSWDEQTAFGINELGNVSGSQAGINPYRTTSIPYNPAVLEGTRWTVMDIALVYPRGTRPGVYADIYTLLDINDTGYTVGSRRRYGLAGSSSILIAPPYNSVKSGADVTYLPTGGVANAINNQNLIVGTSAASTATPAFAYLYDGVDVTNLGTLAGGSSSGAYDINELDVVVGYSQTSSGNHAFIWDAAAGMRDLNEFVTDAWILVSANAINDAGDIVGMGLLNGQSHGFLLTDVLPPEIPNEPPLAVATADVTRGKAPLPVAFSSAGSVDPDGVIASYSWDFGDSTGSSTEANPTHTYTAAGSYIAVLTVTDDGGLTATATVDITVRKAKVKR